MTGRRGGGAALLLLALAGAAAARGDPPGLSWTPVTEGLPVFPGEVVRFEGRTGVVTAPPALGQAPLRMLDAPEAEERVAALEALEVARRVEVLGPEAAVELGEPVEVEWQGRWYQARVRALAPDGALAIHYVGWEAKWDEAAPRSRVRREWRLVAARPGERLRAGDPVSVHGPDGWRAATVEEVGEEQVRVRYLTVEHGQGAADELPWARLHRSTVPLGARPPGLPEAPGRTPAGPLEPGAWVAAESAGRWYLALVLEDRGAAGPEDGGVRIRWAGWEPRWDEVLARDRLRVGFPPEMLEKRPPSRE